MDSHVIKDKDPKKYLPLVFSSSTVRNANNSLESSNNFQLQPIEKKLGEEMNHKTNNIKSITDVQAVGVSKKCPSIVSLENKLSEECTPFINNTNLSKGEIENSVISISTSNALTAELALNLEQNGKYTEAVEVYLKLNETEQLSINIKNNMAIAYCRLGRYTEALQIFSHILKVLELEEVEVEVKVTSDSDPALENSQRTSTLSVKNNLALTQNMLGMYTESYKMLMEVLEEREATLDTNHPEVLATKHNIALVMGNQGRNKEALELYTELLSLREDILGPDHLDTMSTKMNMATLLTSLGNYETALLYLTDVLNKQETILGKEHPQTLKTSHNFAVVLNLQQNYIKALGIYKEIIQTRKKILGKDHPDTLRTSHNAALIIHAQGNYRRSMRRHQNISHKLQQLFITNPQHSFILTNNLNTASVLVSQRDYGQALKDFQQVLDNQQLDSYANTHPEKLVAQFNKASVLMSLKKFEEAQKVYSDILECDKYEGEFCGEGNLKRASVTKQQERCRKIVEANANASIWSKLFNFILE